MLLWHLHIRKVNSMLGKLTDFFINQLYFSSRLSGLTSMMSFRKTSRVCVPAFHSEILMSKLICFQNFVFLGQPSDFTLIIFMNLSTVSFETENIIKLLFSWGGRGPHLPSLPNLFFLPSWLYGQLYMEYEGIF